MLDIIQVIVPLSVSTDLRNKIGKKIKDLFPDRKVLIMTEGILLKEMSIENLTKLRDKINKILKG